MDTLRLSWRNLWRNPRRTALTASALGLGVLMMVATADYTKGLFGRMIETTANGRTGHAQLHAPGFRVTREEELVLKAPAALLAEVRALPQVQSAAARVWGSALLAIGDRSRGVQLFGVAPDEEAHVGRWIEGVREGRFLQAKVAGAQGDAARSGSGGEVVLGQLLARRLDVQLGARVVLTAADIHTGEARSELLQVVGLLRSGDAALDDGTAIVNRDVAARMLGLGDAVHEVVLRLHDHDSDPVYGVDREDEAAIAAAIAPLNRADSDGRGVEAVPWHTVQPMVAEMLRMQGAWMAIFLGLIFFVIGFVVVGTMSMALLERTWEFGLLRALGTSPGRIASMVLGEAAWLGLVGGVGGALGGYTLSRILEHVGIDFGEDVTMIVSFHEPIRPVPDLLGAFGFAAIFVLLTVLVSAFAAYRATRIEPGIALRQR
jgi:ABC-type lipoprotein release transport system permease subunit